MAKSPDSPHPFPGFIEDEIRRAWAVDCFPWQGESNWDELTSAAADKIVEKHPWLSDYRESIRCKIGNS